MLPDSLKVKPKHPPRTIFFISSALAAHILHSTADRRACLS